MPRKPATGRATSSAACGGQTDTESHQPALDISAGCAHIAHPAARRPRGSGRTRPARRPQHREPRAGPGSRRRRRPYLRVKCPDHVHGCLGQVSLCRSQGDCHERPEGRRARSLAKLPSLPDAARPSGSATRYGPTLPRDLVGLRGPGKRGICPLVRTPVTLAPCFPRGSVTISVLPEVIGPQTSCDSLAREPVLRGRRPSRARGERRDASRSGRIAGADRWLSR